MKFKLIGDPNDNYSGPDEDTIHGVTLNRDDFVEVKDEKVAKRLKGHTHVCSEEEWNKMEDAAVPKRRGRPPKHVVEARKPPEAPKPFTSPPQPKPFVSA